MNTRYHFNETIYYSFADLSNAFRKANGYFPTKCAKQIGCDLYY